MLGMGPGCANSPAGTNPSGSWLEDLAPPLRLSRQEWGQDPPGIPGSHVPLQKVLVGSRKVRGCVLPGAMPAARTGVAAQLRTGPWGSVQGSLIIPPGPSLAHTHSEDRAPAAAPGGAGQPPA